MHSIADNWQRKLKEHLDNYGNQAHIPPPNYMFFTSFFWGSAITAIAAFVIFFLLSGERALEIFIFTWLAIIGFGSFHYENVRKFEKDKADIYYAYHFDDKLKIEQDKANESITYWKTTNLELQQKLEKLTKEKQTLVAERDKYADVIKRNEHLLSHEFIEEVQTFPRFNAQGELTSSITFVRRTLKGD